jgi:L-seryl-tRNA(Ser) seleniumtransferase
VSKTRLFESLRELPSVDEVLGQRTILPGFQSFPRDLVVEEIRCVISELRDDIQKGIAGKEGYPISKTELNEEIRSRVLLRLACTEKPSVRRVINASGVILHTNLGRAPLSENALASVHEVGGGYCNLEYDLTDGRRGKRDIHAGTRLEKLLGVPAIVVNNNAAAIFLALQELAHGGEAIVSRGELVEIGDGFRIPDIMARGGARLREVGATNRTSIADYRGAVNKHTGALLRVHRSNFQIVGFTERPELDELVALSREIDRPLVEDLGSGCIYDLSPHGFKNEPVVIDSLRAGVDIVTFSGDKLLGGPQAGIIAGKSKWIKRIRENPLFRALRADKMAYAALDATLRDYQMQRWDEIPVLRMLRMPIEEIQSRAHGLAAMLEGLPAEVDLAEGQSLPGGGATPEQTLPTTLVRLQPQAGGSADSLQRRLRLNDPPIVVRCEDDRILIDLRTVLPGEDATISDSLRRVLQEKII